MAAGALLIQEAGGLVSDFSGGHDFLEKGQIVAGNTKCFGFGAEFLIGYEKPLSTLGR